MKLIYIAGPYRGNVEENVKKAQFIGDKLVEAGVAFVCPHSNGSPHDGGDDSYWLESTLEIMRRCDGVLLLSGWTNSSGTLGEIREALRLGKNIFYPKQIEDCIEWALS